MNLSKSSKVVRIAYHNSHFWRKCNTRRHSWRGRSIRLLSEHLCQSGEICQPESLCPIIIFFQRI